MLIKFAYTILLYLLIPIWYRRNGNVGEWVARKGVKPVVKGSLVSFGGLLLLRSLFVQARAYYSFGFLCAKLGSKHYGTTQFIYSIDAAIIGRGFFFAIKTLINREWETGGRKFRVLFSLIMPRPYLIVVCGHCKFRVGQWVRQMSHSFFTTISALTRSEWRKLLIASREIDIVWLLIMAFDGQWVKQCTEWIYSTRYPLMRFLCGILGAKKRYR